MASSAFIWFLFLKFVQPLYKYICLFILSTLCIPSFYVYFICRNCFITQKSYFCFWKDNQKLTAYQYPIFSGVVYKLVHANSDPNLHIALCAGSAYLVPSHILLLSWWAGSFITENHLQQKIGIASHCPTLQQQCKTLNPVFIHFKILICNYIF